LWYRKPPESLNESSYYVPDESYGEHEESYARRSGSGIALGGAHNDSLHRLSKSSLTSTLQNYPTGQYNDSQQYQGTGTAGSTISGYNTTNNNTLRKDSANCSTPSTHHDYQNLFETTVNTTTAYTPSQASWVGRSWVLTLRDLKIENQHLKFKFFFLFF
jgi:hypothetical protein